MSELATFISELFKDLDIRRRWLVIAGFIILAIALVIGFEYLSGFVYYQNLERKVVLLKELHALSKDGISNDHNLSKVYIQAVAELENHKLNPIAIPTIVLTNSVTFWKAASGASIGLLFFFYALFAVTGKEKVNSAFGAVFVAVISGFVAAFIPTIYNPWVNYIGFPVILLTLLILLGRGTKANA